MGGERWINSHVQSSAVVRRGLDVISSISSRSLSFPFPFHFFLAHACLRYPPELMRIIYIDQYVDPNYAGGGYDEYFGDSAEGSLDCHSPDSSWVLLGVYRQEFYQFIEQISKHLW